MSISKKFSSDQALRLSPMQSSVLGLDEFFESTDRKILPYVNGAFKDGGGSPLIPVDFALVNLTMYDASGMVADAEKLAKEFRYNVDEYNSFIQRLKINLSQHVSLFDHVLARSSERFADSGNLLESIFLQLTQEQSSPMSNHHATVVRIDMDDHDFVFNMVRLIRVLNPSVRSLTQQGVVVICASQKLVAPFFMLTQLIHRSNPPSHVISFLPIVSTGTAKSIQSGTISIILNSADIEAATLSCFTSLNNYSASKWKSSIILVEESIETKVIDKFDHLCTRSFPCDCNSSPNAAGCEDSGQADLVAYFQKQYATKAITCNQECSHKKAVVIQNIPPSALSNDVRWNIGSVGYLIRFRTVKEALSIANHFINQCRFDPGSLTTLNDDLALSVNLWSSQAPMSWWLAMRLYTAGVRNVFVNASSDMLLAKIYTSSIEFDSLQPHRSQSASDNLDESVLHLTNLLSSSARAQTAWYSKGLSKLRTQLSQTVASHCTQLKDSLPSWNNIESSINNILGKSDDFKFICQNVLSESCLLLARQWLLPKGPILFTMTADCLSGKMTIQNLMNLFFISLGTGNSVILYQTKNIGSSAQLTELFNLIQKLQSHLPSNLFTVVTKDTVSNQALPALLSAIPHYGHIIDLPLKAPTDEEIVSCLLRNVKLYWSIGGDIFTT